MTIDLEEYNRIKTAWNNIDNQYGIGITLTFTYGQHIETQQSEEILKHYLNRMDHILLDGAEKIPRLVLRHTKKDRTDINRMGNAHADRWIHYHIGLALPAKHILKTMRLYKAIWEQGYTYTQTCWIDEWKNGSAQYGERENMWEQYALNNSQVSASGLVTAEDITIAPSDVVHDRIVTVFGKAKTIKRLDRFTERTRTGEIESIWLDQWKQEKNKYQRYNDWVKRLRSGENDKLPEIDEWLAENYRGEN